MGNNFTVCRSVTYGRKGGGQLSAYLTIHQIHIVQDTWDLIKDDLAKLGIIIFTR